MSDTFCANIQIYTDLSGAPSKIYRERPLYKIPYYFFQEMVSLYITSFSATQRESFPRNENESHAYVTHPFEIYVDDRENPVIVSNGFDYHEFTDDMMKHILEKNVQGRCVELIMKPSIQSSGGSYNNKSRHSKKRTNKTRKNKFPKRIKLYSNPRRAQYMAHKYLGKTAKLYPARNPEKKYSILDQKHGKWVNFGQMGYEDYTKHHDKSRRKNYLTRTKYMRGDWKKNPYSANNLSRHILW